MTLATVADAALAVAAAEAERVRGDASARATEVIASARAEAAELLERRRAAAELLAAQERAALIAQARAEARASVLRAQRSVLESARAASLAAARGLAADPRYLQLIERLALEARERLAPGGPVEIVDSPGGGFVARAGSREIDYSLERQVARCLDALPGQLEALWG